MHFTIISIGKWKSGPEKALYEHYAGRLPWKLTLRECELKKNAPPNLCKEKEAELLLAACEGHEAIYALDEKGKDITSTSLAHQLQNTRERGIRNTAFLIGGSDGLHDSVRSKATFLFSLGRVTWPHLLVRGLLAEQLYRSYTILNNHPYHRE